MYINPWLPPLAVAIEALTIVYFTVGRPALKWGFGRLRRLARD